MRKHKPESIHAKLSCSVVTCFVFLLTIKLSYIETTSLLPAFVKKVPSDLPPASSSPPWSAAEAAVRLLSFRPWLLFLYRGLRFSSRFSGIRYSRYRIYGQSWDLKKPAI